MIDYVDLSAISKKSRYLTVTSPRSLVQMYFRWRSRNEDRPSLRRVVVRAGLHRGLSLRPLSVQLFEEWNSDRRPVTGVVSQISRLSLDRQGFEPTNDV